MLSPKWLSSSLERFATRTRRALRAAGIMELSMGIANATLAVVFLLNAQNALHRSQPAFESGLPEADAAVYVSTFPFVIVLAAAPILASLLALSRRLWLISLVSSIVFVLPFAVGWVLIFESFLSPLMWVIDEATLTQHINPWAFYLVELPIWLVGVALPIIPVILIARSKREFGGVFR